MNQTISDNIVYSRDVVEFVTVANEYCSFVESAARLTTSQALDRSRKILPLLYLKATLLPEVEQLLDEDIEKFVTELDYNILLQKWMQLLGEYDSFQEIFKPGMEPGEDALGASISENILDIYQPVKDFISSYSLGNEEVMNDALYECIYRFNEYWGQRLVNVLRAIHMVITSGEDIDGGQSGNSNKQEKNESGWVDKFFGQFRDDNIE